MHTSYEFEFEKSIDNIDATFATTVAETVKPKVGMVFYSIKEIFNLSIIDII